MNNVVLFFLILFLTDVQNFNVFCANDYLHYVCSSNSNGTDNNAYQSNLAKLFTSLSTESVASKGFGANTIAVPVPISGLVLCRGDVKFSMCSTCLNKSIIDIQTLCPNSEEAAIWYDFCLLHYSNNDFLSSTDNSQQVIMWNSENVTSKRFTGWNPPNAVAESYLKAMVQALLGSVAYQAAYHSEKRFMVGDMNITSSGPTIYSMSQCTPDMANYACHACLQYLINHMLNNFDGRQGGCILGVRCSLRYEVYNLPYEIQGLLPISSTSGTVKTTEPDVDVSDNQSTPAPLATTSMPDKLQSTPSPSVSTDASRTNKASIAFPGGSSKLLIIVINVTGALLLLSCLIGFYWLKSHRYSGIKTSQMERRLGSIGKASSIWRTEGSSDFTLFDFNQIAKATENFSLCRKLGQGGFGTVYKGVLEDGLELAVKRLSAQSFQGIDEFKNEIQLIAKLQHTNLVRLVGWCIHGDEKLLVYEFMQNKSLDTFIFALELVSSSQHDKKQGALLNWEKRLKVIEGIAQGLLYLHKHSRLRIVHRDLKASNILLDSEMIPRISDFGLARIFDPKDLQANTNRVVGTYGYMAPEYASEGLFSIKSDVYSFGVLLLEIVSGKRNMGFRQFGDFFNLAGYAWDRWKQGQISELICPTLTDASRKQIERCIHVALLCVQENPIYRPIISDVITFLSTENLILPAPKQPAYFNIRVTENAFESSYFYGSSRSLNYITMSLPEGR